MLRDGVNVDLDALDMQRHLDEAVAGSDTPGAAVAIRHGDDVREFASGVRSVDDPVAATPDTLFQIGSITKLLTATLVLQLVDEGKAALDDTLDMHLPDLQLRTPDAPSKITIEHLLTHSSGIPGDYLAGDWGHGDDAIERYVADLGHLELVHEPGAHFSYCNSGWVIAGRIVEVLRETPFAQALTERLAHPLDALFLSWPADILRHRAAVGHSPSADGASTVAYGMAPGQAPSGSQAVARARDLTAFATAMMRGGIAPDGTRLLSEESVRRMTTPQIDFPMAWGHDRSMAFSWFVGEVDGHRTLGHGGSTNGSASHLVAFPDHDLSVAMLTNSTMGGAVMGQVAKVLHEELLGIESPITAPVPPVADDAVDLDLYVGVYASPALRLDITRGEQGLLMAQEMRLFSDDPVKVPPRPLVVTSPTGAAMTGPDGNTALEVVFLEPDNEGRPRLVFMGRMYPRVE